MSGELMRDINGYEGLYAITSCGKVWSYRRKRFLTNGKGNNGYYSTTLTKNGEKKRFLIHRLVAEAYLPNLNNLPQVNHKDENKEHNYISNLEWCDAKYNSSYGTKGERSARKNGKAVYCIELNRMFESIQQAGRELGISASHISEVCRDIYEHTKGYHFYYMEVE